MSWTFKLVLSSFSRQQLSLRDNLCSSFAQCSMCGKLHYGYNLVSLMRGQRTKVNVTRDKHIRTREILTKKWIRNKYPWCFNGVRSVQSGKAAKWVCKGASCGHLWPPSFVLSTGKWFYNNASNATLFSTFSKIV